VHVLHVAAGNAYGGIERMLVTLASVPHPELAQAFAVAFPGRLEQELRAAGAPVHRLPSPRAARPLRVLQSRRAFAAIAARERPDVAVFHGAWPHAMFAAAARRAGVRIVFWQHQPIRRPRWPDRWAAMTTPDFLIFNSRYTASFPAFPGVCGATMYYPVAAPPAIPDDERVRQRDERGASAADVVVLLAARAERWKGQTVLLDAVARLDPAMGLRVWIAGGPQSGSERRYYEEEIVPLARAAGDRVTLLGQRSDVPLLMRLADIYCQPNLQPEPFGISVAEAMLAGCPCIVSGAGGAAELLGDEGGLVTPLGDAGAVAEAIQQLGGSAERRRRMGTAARDRAIRLTDPAARLDEFARLLRTGAA
jgi:glycosyltransferase involved in cell wall biosynthesis